MNSFGLIFLSWLAWSLPAPTAHDIHISKTLIEYSAADESLQVMMHYYVDDFELAISMGGVTEKLNLCTEKEHPKGDTYTEAYLRKHFKVLVNGEPSDFNWVGKEPSQDLLAIWCYLEIPLPDVKIESLEITQPILTELYDDQKNIVNVKLSRTQRGYLLFDKEKTQDKIEF